MGPNYIMRADDEDDGPANNKAGKKQKNQTRELYPEDDDMVEDY